MSTSLIQMRLGSEALGFETSVTVLAPVRNADTRPPKVLYLFHGYSDDDSIWTRRTALERHLGNRNVVVVMPNAGLSFYTDMENGQAYNRFVSSELPAVIRRMFRVSTRREDTFVAGLSMGGYGAFRLALENPGRFAAAASLSGALDITAKTFIEPGPFRRQLERIFGDLGKLQGGPHDLFQLMRAARRKGVRLPRLYACCGTEDFLYQDNLRFRDHAAKEGVPLVYEESTGMHNWEYWDCWIQRVLQWMFDPPPRAPKARR